MNRPRIHTVGHSTRSADELVALLREAGVELLVRGLHVVHLIDAGKHDDHELTGWARVDAGTLSYPALL